MPYFATKQHRDANHKDIVEFVEKHGIEVIETFQPLDCLFYNPRLGSGWAEIKIPGSKANVTELQIQFMAFTKMPVAFVRNEREALEFGQTLVGLSQRQKDNLAVFLRTAERKKYHPAGTIERVLSWE